MAEVTRHSLPASKLTNLPCQFIEFSRPGDLCNGTNPYWHTLEEMLPTFQVKGWTALQAASAYAQYHCVQLLIAAGADVSAQDDRYRTPLDLVGCAHYMGHRIDENNFMETVDLLLKAGGQFSNYGDSGKYFDTPLHTAVELESEAAVKHLLYLGASPTAWNSQGLTAMHMCVKKRNKELLQILASHKSSKNGSNLATIDVVARWGQTVLGEAVGRGWLEGVCIALSAGATNIKTSYERTRHSLSFNETTVIHLATYQGNEDILNHLLKFCNHDEIEKHINTPDKFIGLPLYKAVERNQYDCACLLINRGAKVNIKARDSDTTLLNIAVENNNTEMAEMIIQQDKATVHAVDYMGRSPMYVACRHGHKEMIALLLRNRARIGFHIMSKSETTVLHLAAYQGSEDILNHLLKFCNHDEIEKHINTPHEQYGVPLYKTVEHNQYENACLLITRGAKVNIKARDWESTLLNIAVRNNNTKMAEMIIQQDKKTVQAVDNAGRSPIYEACRHGHKEMIALLLRNGADISGEESENEKKLPIEMLMINVSKPTKLLREVFDSNIISLCKETEDKVSVDFRVLLPKCGMKKMKVIQALLDTGNTYDQHSLLLHPLVESFLYLQWRSLLPFFYVILALQVCFVLSLNVFALSLFWFKDRKMEPVPIVFRSSAWVYIIYFTAFLLTMQEVIVIKMKTVRRNLLSFEVSVKWLSTIFAVVLPQVVSWESNSYPEWVRLFGSATLLLTWVRVMYLLSRLPGYGYYVLMYGKVANKVFKILVSLGFLIVGFCVSFMIQFHAQAPFEDPFSSLLTTMVMMSSELGYNEVINKQNVEHTSASLIMIRLIFVPFLILVSIILMNLLVGVAVNDVNALEIIGNINRLKKQVQFIKSFEDTGSYNFIKGIFERWSSNDSIFMDSISLRTLQNHGLPARLTEAISENALLQKWQSDEKQSTELFQTKLNEVHQIIVKQNTFVPAKLGIPDIEGKVLPVVSKVLEVVNEVLEEIVKLRTDMELNKNRIG